MNKRLSELIGYAINDEPPADNLILKEEGAHTVFNAVFASSEEEAIQKVKDAIPDPTDLIDFDSLVFMPVDKLDIEESAEELAEEPDDVPETPRSELKKYYLRYKVEAAIYYDVSGYLGEDCDLSDWSQIVFFRKKLLEEPVFITEEEYDYRITHMEDNDLFIEEL